jgi:hypothetical protein
MDEVNDEVKQYNYNHQGKNGVIVERMIAGGAISVGQWTDGCEYPDSEYAPAQEVEHMDLSRPGFGIVKEVREKVQQNLNVKKQEIHAKFLSDHRDAEGVPLMVKEGPVDTASVDQILAAWKKACEDKKAAAAVESEVVSEELPCWKSALIFYVNVGNMSPGTAKKFMDRQKEQAKDFIDRLPSHVGRLWWPIRNGPSRIESIQF